MAKREKERWRACQNCARERVPCVPAHSVMFRDVNFDTTRGFTAAS
jgi:hypothetical protein